MTLHTPEHSLLATRTELSEFYLAFSRYEFALKATKFVKQTDRGAQIDWDKLAEELGDLDQLLANRRTAVHELLDRPPKKLNLVENNQLKWQDDLPKPTWGPTRVFLESAIAQPRMTFDGAELYPTIVEKASALGFSLVMNHPFVEGNKRTGHAAMETFLVLNGLEIQASVEEQEKIILQLAAGSSH